jgi:hypothetical protein
LRGQFASVFTTTTDSSLITIETQNELSFFPPALVKEFLTYIHKTPAKKAMTVVQFLLLSLKTVPWSLHHV